MAAPRLQGLTPAAIQQVIGTAEALEAGHIDQAEARIAPLLGAYPGHPEVLRLHAGTLGARGKLADAAAIMQRALVLRPDDGLYHNTLASLFSAAGEYDGAIIELRRACELQPGLAVAWFNLGIMLTRCVRHVEAIEALKRAVALDPRHMQARAQLADILRTEDRIQESAAEYRRIIAEQPWTGMAWWGLADLKTLRLSEDDIEHMQRALRHARASDDDLIAIGFALAKALDDHGRYSESLQALAEANAIARRRLVWDSAAFSTRITSILEAFATPPAQTAQPELGAEVIFVVGMPRSGSTLVEQILASHSQVEGPGELPDLPLTLREESRRIGQPFPAWVAKATADDWQRLGTRYLQRTAFWQKQRPRFIDKLPSNWMYVGAIRAMLPAARIIVCRRDPLETCFACYRQHLNNNEYTRTFHDLAARWRDFNRAVEQWRSVHPQHVCEHVYEDLLRDPRARIEKLLAFCGLDFEESCVEFHATHRDVRSPSAMQVREPLRRDTARSHRYGSLLDPLRAALDLAPFAG